MAIGLNGLLHIGNNALRSSQTAINVTGNNVGNVNTVGYTRQLIRFQEAPPVDAYPGQMGTGTYVQEITRSFDRFLENSFLDQNSQANMWAEQSAIMNSVQEMFNEATTDGIHNQMSEFFNGWSTLSTKPDSLPAREALLSQSANLSTLFRDTMNSLTKTKREMDRYITQSVDAVNSLVDQIAAVNQEIMEHHNPPYNNANTLLDERDRLVRELGTLVDIEVHDNGPRDFVVNLKAGMPLVEGESKYYISNAAPFYENATKNFTGELIFEGTDNNEYTLEFVSPTEFKVSLDGGKTFVTDSKGNSTFTVPPVGEKLILGELKISFEGEGYKQGSTPFFDVGDRFYIVPKDNIKWHEPTRDPIDVSKNVQHESIGGKLGAYIASRDTLIGEYEEKMNALAESLIWEVNRHHSQGSGLTPFEQNIGTTVVEDIGLPLGSPLLDLTFGDRLTNGNLNMHFFDAETGKPLKSGPLNFNPDPNGEPMNFDPTVHSMVDVAAAINRSYRDEHGKPLITATIQGGQLQLNAAKGVNYKMGSDTTGIWAALGVNTFFAGDSADTIEVNPYLLKNPTHVNAQSVDGNGEANEGDGTIAGLIGKLASETVNISTTWQTKRESLLDNYAGVVGLVGADARNAKFNADYYGTLAGELNNQTLSKTGVNLDEEMTLLIKFQHSYTAAAKLITTADEMFQTLLGLKP